MEGVYASWGIYLPTDWLVAVATSGLRLAVYRLQPLYGLMRFLHLVGMAGFFGLLMFVNLRGCGAFATAVPQSATRAMLSVVRWMFALTIVTGIFLFLYDPIQTGSHTMFLPKLILIVAGYANAYVFRVDVGPAGAVVRRWASGVSLAIWTAVIICSVWNQSERPLKPIHSLQGIERYTE